MLLEAEADGKADPSTSASASASASVLHYFLGTPGFMDHQYDFGQGGLS